MVLVGPNGQEWRCAGQVMGAFFLNVRSGARKRVLSRAQMRLADRSEACEGPGWSRTEHMQQESGYVGGVPKMAAGAEAFLEDAGCWQASLQNARELLEAAGARERARVGGSGRRVDCPRERGLLLDRLKRARRRDPRRRSAGWLGFFQNNIPGGDLHFAPPPPEPTVES